MRPQLLTVENIGAKGLNTDVRQWSLGPEYITNGANFRIFSGSIRTAGGFTQWDDTAPQYFPGYLLNVKPSGGDFWVAPGRTAVYMFNGAAWEDISSAGGYAGLGTGDELLWTGCELGDIPVFNNPQHEPEYWSPAAAGTDLVALPFDASNSWSDKGYTCQVIRSHKNFLFALNITEGAAEYRDGYRWSHPADLGGIPFTWDETDLSAIAGRSSLGGRGGRIMDGLSLRDSFVIYSEGAIDILDPTNDEFVWRRRELSSTYGVLSVDSIAEAKGTHFVLTDGDVVINDGTNIQSIMHDRIRTHFTSNIGDNYERSFVVRNDWIKELWFCVPTSAAEYPNLAYIYNYRDNSWAIRDLPYTDTTTGIAFASYGSQSEPAQTWEDFESLPLALQEWAVQTQSWGSRKTTPLNETVVGIDNYNSKLIILDPLGAGTDGDTETSIERTNYPLDGHKQVTTITRIYPHIEGTQPVSIRFGSHDYAGSPVRWKPAVTFTPGVDRKIDLRTTGELHAWRVESIGTGQWKMSGFDINYVKAGLR